MARKDAQLPHDSGKAHSQKLQQQHSHQPKHPRHSHNPRYRQDGTEPGPHNATADSGTVHRRGSTSSGPPSPSAPAPSSSSQAPPPTLEKLAFPADDRPLLKRVHWLFAFILTVTPLLSLFGLLFVPWHPKTALLAVIAYFFTGLGITAGYHRLWSHRSYKATVPLRIVLALAGAGALQGSIRWWCRGHRAHHRYTDTNKDPYCAKRGFWWSHILWLYLRAHPRDFGRVDVEDIKRDPVAEFQHQHFVPISLTVAFVLPTVIAGCGWGDWLGGFFFAGALRMVVVHHATFCVNSLAHWLGDTPFDDRKTPRDHFLTAIITLGEGYHNFHHEFPNDYRNALGFWQYDPTKWLLRTLSCFGLAYGLRTFSDNEIQKGRLNMMQKKLDSQRSMLDWGRPVEQLPVWTTEKYEAEVRDGWELILIDGVVYDVSSFMDDHPGGQALLKAHMGRDATRAFNGGVYYHNNSARNLMGQFRVAKIGKPGSSSLETLNPSASVEAGY